jgi:hypothetical protein
MTNNDPFKPWNNPMNRDNPNAPWNNPMKRDNPFAAWNDPFGHGEYESESNNF